MTRHSGIRYTSYLSRPELWALDEACRSIKSIGSRKLGRDWVGDQR